MGRDGDTRKAEAFYDQIKLKIITEAHRLIPTRPGRYHHDSRLAAGAIEFDSAATRKRMESRESRARIGEERGCGCVHPAIAKPSNLSPHSTPQCHTKKGSAQTTPMLVTAGVFGSRDSAGFLPQSPQSLHPQPPAAHSAPEPTAAQRAAQPVPLLNITPFPEPTRIAPRNGASSIHRRSPARAVGGIPGQRRAGTAHVAAHSVLTLRQSFAGLTADRSGC